MLVLGEDVGVGWRVPRVTMGFLDEFGGAASSTPRSMRP